MAYKNYITKNREQFFTVAFYNVENLFDTIDNPKTLDDDFSPKGDYSWTQKKYQKKIFKLGTTLSNIGFKETAKAPVLIGLAEVENIRVVKDLVNSKHLINKKYDIVHYDSPDERGIDVAFIYQTEFFKVTHQEQIPLLIDSQRGDRDYTRDILLVSGLLNGEQVHVLVNHWPSRRDGAHLTAYKRVAAAEKNREIIDRIRTEEGEDAKIIVMGDFNDDPNDTSISEHLVQNDFYNPMEQLLTRTEGTTSYRGRWNLFDQIIFSNNFHKYEKGKHAFAFSKIFNEEFLKVYRGRYKGKPFRTFAGGKYKGGYSDHFPVYMVLKLNK